MWYKPISSNVSLLMKYFVLRLDDGDEEGEEEEEAIEEKVIKYILCCYFVLSKWTSTPFLNLLILIFYFHSWNPWSFIKGVWIFKIFPKGGSEFSHKKWGVGKIVGEYSKKGVSLTNTDTF